MEHKNNNWSEQDNRVHKLTGFVPGERDKRQCVSCGKTGHYYYECNDGKFLKAADALAEALKVVDGMNEKKPEKQGGFFNLPQDKVCKDKSHEPPTHIHIPQGKGYRHVCPSCGKVTDLIPPQISF